MKITVETNAGELEDVAHRLFKANGNPDIETLRVMLEAERMEVAKVRSAAKAWENEAKTLEKELKDLAAKKGARR